MFGSILRWIAASGRPEALEERNVDDEVAVRYTGDNWLSRTVRRNRVFTACCIAIGLFTFGGFAWSARAEPSLVRKQVDTQSVPATETFDELLDIPVYEGVTEQLQDEAQATANRHSGFGTPPPPVETFDFGTTAQDTTQDANYNPFTSLPDQDQPIQQPNTTTDPTNSFQSDSFDEVPEFSAPTQSDTNNNQFGSPVMPSFGNEPTLDNSGDQAQPLLRTGFTRRRR